MVLHFKTLDIEVSNFTIEPFSPKTQKLHKFKKVLSYFMYFWRRIYRFFERRDFWLSICKNYYWIIWCSLQVLLNIKTNLNKIMIIMPLKESIMKTIMKFTNVNDVDKNSDQNWNLQQFLKNNWNCTIWIWAFLKENFFSSVMLAL